MRTEAEVLAKLEQLKGEVDDSKPFAFGNTVATLSMQALNWVLGNRGSIYGEELEEVSLSEKE